MTATAKQRTEAEQKAIDEFEARRAAEQEAKARANRSVSDIYIEEFDAITSGEKARPHIMEVLAGLAAFFHDDDPEFRHDPYVDQNGDEKPGSDPNNAQFNQRGLMGNLCQQADWMLQREERRLQYLGANAAKLRREHANGEIDTMQLEAAELEYGRCKIVNLPILEDFRAAVMAAHVAQFGEEWRRPVKADKATTTRTLDDRFAHSERRSRL